MIEIRCDCGTMMEKHRHGLGFGAEDHWQCPKCKKEIRVEEL